MTAVPEAQNCPVCNQRAWTKDPRDLEFGDCIHCGWPVVYLPSIDGEPTDTVSDFDGAISCLVATRWARRVLKERDEARTERDEARKERDELRDRVESYKEDFASLDACLERVGQERDEARTQRDDARAWARRWKQLAGRLREVIKLGQMIAERQTVWTEEAHAEIARIKDRLGEVLAANGCECECDCIQEPDGHEDDCDPCLACRVDRVVWKESPR